MFIQRCGWRFSSFNILWACSEFGVILTIFCWISNVTQSPRFSLHLFPVVNTCRKLLSIFILRIVIIILSVALFYDNEWKKIKIPSRIICCSGYFFATYLDYIAWRKYNFSNNSWAAGRSTECY